MISWSLDKEREMVLYYANLLDDTKTVNIIQRGEIDNKTEALHVAEFFWKMVEKSNEEQYKNDSIECEFILVKVINTLMAYFRNAGYEQGWEAFADI